MLEIGCGPGAATREIVRHSGAGHLLAIDRSEKAIAQARAAARSSGRRCTSTGGGWHDPCLSGRTAGCRLVDDKERVRLLVRALNRMKSQYEELLVLCEVLDRQEDERLSQRWGRRWEEERRALRFLEARN